MDTRLTSREYIVLLLALCLSIFLIPGASGLLQCTVQQSCTNTNTTYGISFSEYLDDSSSNMHFDNNTAAAYLSRGGYVLCCNSTAANVTDFCGGNDYINRRAIYASAYDVTNAHFELPALSNYNVDVCVSSPTAYYSCTPRNSSCTAREACMYSISDDTNAHIGSCGNYTTRMCCTDDDMDHDEYSDFDQGTGGAFNTHDDCDDTDPMNSPRRINYYCPQCGSKELVYAWNSFAGKDDQYSRECYFERSTINNSIVNSSTLVRSHIHYVNATDSYIEDSSLNSSTAQFSVITDTVFPCENLAIEGTVENGILTAGRITYQNVNYDAPFNVNDICEQQSPFAGEFSLEPSVRGQHAPYFHLLFDSKQATNLDVVVDLSPVGVGSNRTLYDGGSINRNGQGPDADATAGDGIFTQYGGVGSVNEGPVMLLANASDNVGNDQIFNTTMIIDNTDPNASILINDGDVGTQETLVELSLSFYDDNGIDSCRLSNSDLSQLFMYCDFETYYNYDSSFFYCGGDLPFSTQNNLALTSSFDEFADGFSGNGVENYTVVLFQNFSQSVSDGTVQFMFKPTWSGSDGSEHMLFMNPEVFTSTSDFIGGFAFYKSTGNELTFAWSNGTVRTVNASAAAIQEGVWHSFAVTWSQSTGDVAIYLDGEEIGSTTTMPGYPTTSNETGIIFGYDGSTSIPNSGTFDDLSLWNYTKTEEEINSDALSSGAYEFEECSSQVLFSLVPPNGNKYVYFEVKDTAGNTRVVSDNIYMGIEDATPAENLTVTDDGEFTNSDSTIHAIWEAFDPQSPVLTYEYRVLDSSNGSYITTWKTSPNNGIDNDVSIDNLPLEDNHTYVVEVRAFNAANVSGDVASSDGITVDLVDPLLPTLSALNHTNATASAQQSPVFLFNSSDNVSKVYGYSFSLSGNAGATPDTIAENFGKRQFVVANDTATPVHHSDVAVNENGDYLVVWHQNNDTTYDVYAKRYNAFGAAISPDIKVNTVTAGQQRYPVVAALPSGQFVIAWETIDVDGLGVAGRILQSNNQFLDVEFTVNEHTNDAQFEPAVAAHDNGFVIAWTSVDQDGSNNGTFAKRYALNGSSEAPPANEQGLGIGNEFQVANSTANHQEKPTVAYLPSGDFIIAYENEVGADPDDIYFKIYNSTGTSTYGEARVHAVNANAQTTPSLDAGSSGFVVVWDSDSDDGDGSGVYGHAFNVDGENVSGEFQVNVLTDGDQDRPVVKMGGHDSYIVAWNDHALNMSRYQYYRFPADTMYGVQNVSLSEQGQDNVSLAFGSESGFFATWTDQEGGSSTGVYGAIYPLPYTSYSVLDDDTYYFTVCAIDFAGNQGSCDEFNLIIDASQPDTPEFTHGNMYSDDGTIQFNFTEIVDAEYYELRYDTDSGFSAPTIVPGNNETNISINFGVTEETYYVQVHAVGDSGASSAWSSSITGTIDTTDPTVTPQTPNASSTVSTSTPFFTLTTDEACNAVYSLDAWASQYSFDVTGTTYHETKHPLSAADGAYTVNYRCVDFAGNIGTASTAFTIDTSVDVSFVTNTIDTFVYAATLISTTVTAEDSGFSGVSGLEYGSFELYVGGLQTDFSLEEKGDGEYELHFVAPRKAGAYELYVSVSGTNSAKQNLLVRPVRLVVGFSGGSAMDQRSKAVYKQDSVSTFGLASDTDEDEINLTQDSVSSMVGDNAFIFMTRRQAELDNVDQYLDNADFLDQATPTFGYEIDRSTYDIVTALQFSDVVVEGDLDLPPGRYNLVIINAGEITTGADAGKDRLIVRIER